MEPIKALPGKMQMISGDGMFSDKTASFVEMLKNYYVISIIGPQSSGKSYLLNKLFKADFDVLDAAKGDREQTTTGIWIARCENPGMVIMDVEGSDGSERGQDDDTLFERQSAMFCVVLADVLLLNMWFHDIGRQKAANLGLIELIFQERVKIDATKTKIVIVVRDYDDETPFDNMKRQLEGIINKIWEKVHPSSRDSRIIMSDYFDEVIVKGLPDRKFKEEFAQKSNDLSQLLCSFAKRESQEQRPVDTNFAVSSKKIWDSILLNEEIKAADHKVGKSKYVCKKIIKKLLESMNQKKAIWLTVPLTPRQYNEKFLEEYNDILIRYEKETASVISTIRIEKKGKLVMKLLDCFEAGLEPLTQNLKTDILSKAEATLRSQLKQFHDLNPWAIKEVTEPYLLKDFDKNTPTAEELQRYPYPGPYNNRATELLTSIRENIASELKDIAEEKAKDIKFERAVKKTVEVAAKAAIRLAVSFAGAAGAAGGS